jgi:hypothetical protein
VEKDKGILMTQEEREAQEKLKELAKYYAKPYADTAKDEFKKEVTRGIANFGMNPDDVAAAAATAKIASDLANKKLKLKGNITDNISAEVQLSPREQAIRMLYSKSF